MFCIVFIGYLQKVMLWVKNVNLTNKFRIDGNNIFLDQYCQNCFAPQNEPHIATLSFSGVLKHFLQKLTKKLILIPNLSKKIAKKCVGWENCLELQNESNYAVQSYSAVLNHFRR